MAVAYMVVATEKGRLQGTTIEIYSTDQLAKKRVEKLRESLTQSDFDVQKMTIRTVL